jgi:hypothetical protein
VAKAFRGFPPSLQANRIRKAKSCLLNFTVRSFCLFISSLSNDVSNRNDWPVFSHSNTGIVGLNLTLVMNVCVCLFCVCVVLCVYVEALRQADPPSKEPYRLCIRLRNWESDQGATKDYRSTIIIIIIINWKGCERNLVWTNLIVSSRHLPGETEENNRIFQSRRSSQLKFELIVSWIQVRIVVVWLSLFSPSVLVVWSRRLEVTLTKGLTEYVSSSVLFPWSKAIPVTGLGSL